MSDEKELCGRVALVTGGTRGIGAAISKGLKAAGFNVAANYGSSDEAAQKFKAETGIGVFKWDVSSFEACAAGVKQVEAALGPIDVLVNNAGITRDAQLHRKDRPAFRAWSAGRHVWARSFPRRRARGPAGSPIRRP